MGHDAAPRVERVRQRVLVEVCNARCVDVCKPEQAAREVRGVVVRTEHAAKLWVEHRLYLVSENISLIIFPNHLRRQSKKS